MTRDEIVAGLQRARVAHQALDCKCTHAPDCAGCAVFDAAIREVKPTGSPYVDRTIRVRCGNCEIEITYSNASIAGQVYSDLERSFLRAGRR